jgi:hypothetical protein
MNKYGVLIHYIDMGYVCARRKILSQYHFVQKVLRITFRRKREEVTLGSRVLYMYSEDLHYMHSSKITIISWTSSRKR